MATAAAGRWTRRRRLLEADVVLVWLGVLVAVAVAGATVVRAASGGSQKWQLLLLGLLFVFVAMVVGNLRRLLLIALVFDIPFQWDVNVNWHDSAASLGAIGGLTISITTFALAGLYLLWALDGLRSGTETPAPRITGAVPLLVLMLLVIVSMHVAQDRTLSSFELWQLAQAFLLYVYVVSNVRTRRDITFLLGVLFASLLAESLVILALKYTGGSLNAIGIRSHVQQGVGATSGISRLGGTIGAPNAAGSYLTLLLAPALAVLATAVPRWTKRIAAVAVIVGTIALVLTFSRGGWLAFVVSMTVLCVLGARRGMVSPKIPLAIATVLLVLALPFYGPISSRLRGSDAGAAASRGPLNRLALKMIEDKPLTGVGSNNFALEIPRYAGPEFSRDWLYTVHNQYLLTWAELGIAGLITFAWVLIRSVKRGLSAWRRRDGFLSPLALGVTAAIVGQAASMSVELFHARPLVDLFWLLLALLVVLYERARTPEAGETA